MKIRYDSYQDITLILKEEERKRLLSGPSKNFSDMHVSSAEIDSETGCHYLLLTGASPKLEAKFFLGYTLNEEEFNGALEIDGRRGKILIPGDRGLPWRINLSKVGVGFVKIGWPYGVRYNGSNKLFICQEGD